MTQIGFTPISMCIISPSTFIYHLIHFIHYRMMNRNDITIAFHCIRIEADIYSALIFRLLHYYFLIDMLKVAQYYIYQFNKV